MSEELSVEELVQLIQGGEKALIGTLWDRIANFVHAKAKDMHAGDLTEDLEQECYFALLDAVERFDASQGAKFLTYAAYWFNARMRRYLGTQTGAAVLPVNLLARVRKYRRLQCEFQRDHGRRPTGAEVLAATGWQLPDLITVLDNLNADTAVSLDASLDDDDGDFTLADTIAADDDPAGQAEDEVFHEQMRRDVWDTVNMLPARQAEALTQHYRDDRTYKEIGVVMGVSVEGARQICATGIRELRRRKETKTRLRGYYVDIFGEATHGALNTFLRTRMSSTERAALKDMGEWEERKTKW